MRIEVEMNLSLLLRDLTSKAVVLKLLTLEPTKTSFAFSATQVSAAIMVIGQQSLPSRRLFNP